MSLIKIINFNALGDNRGSLVAFEEFKNVPFAIKRVYYIFNTKKGVSRGFHAHKNLQQLVVCVSGKCRMLLDNGIKQEEVWLDSPTKGLLIDSNTWREMHDFSMDCILLVLASEPYNELDYIRSYTDFKKIINNC